MLARTCNLLSDMLVAAAIEIGACDAHSPEAQILPAVDAVPDYAAIVKSDAAIDPASEFATRNYLKRAAEAGVAGR